MKVYILTKRNYPVGVYRKERDAKRAGELSADAALFSFEKELRWNCTILEYYDRYSQVWRNTPFSIEGWETQ